jgi:hypothetical protein
MHCGIQCHDKLQATHPSMALKLDGIMAHAPLGKAQMFPNVPL